MQVSPMDLIYRCPKYEERIVELCNSNNARAYINLNPKCSKQVHKNFLLKATEIIVNNEEISKNLGKKICSDAVLH